MLHDFIPHGCAREDVMKGQLLPLFIIVSMYIIMSMSAEEKKEFFIDQAKSIMQYLAATKVRIGMKKNSPLYRLAVSQQQILTLLVQSQIGYEVAPDIHHGVSWAKVFNDADEKSSDATAYAPAAAHAPAAAGGVSRDQRGGKSRKKRRRRGGKRTRRK